MGRPTEYTPEMDAVILSVLDSEEINRRFVEMGCEAKTPKALVARRHYLKKYGIVGNDASPVEERLAKVMAMRRTVEAEISTAQGRIVDLQEHLTALTEEAERLNEELRQTLHSDGTGTASPP